MKDGNVSIDGDRVRLAPHLRTGWETVFNDVTRDMTMRLRVLGPGLPIRRRISYTQVVRVATACRTTWWAYAGERGGRLRIAPGFITGPTNVPMVPGKGWRYDLLVTVKGGKTIRAGTLKSSAVADALQRELRKRLGLAPVF